MFFFVVCFYFFSPLPWHVLQIKCKRGGGKFSVSYGPLSLTQLVERQLSGVRVSVCCNRRLQFTVICRCNNKQSPLHPTVVFLFLFHCFVSSFWRSFCRMFREWFRERLLSHLARMQNAKKEKPMSRRHLVGRRTQKYKNATFIAILYANSCCILIFLSYIFFLLPPPELGTAFMNHASSWKQVSPRTPLPDTTIKRQSDENLS